MKLIIDDYESPIKHNMAETSPEQLRFNFMASSYQSPLADLSNYSSSDFNLIKKAYGLDLSQLNGKITQKQLKSLLREATDEKNKRTWFNTSAFDDGYDFGDITKSIGATTGDLALDILHGGLSTVEGIVDTGTYLLADLLEWGFGNKNTVTNAANPKEENWANNLSSAMRKNADFDSYGAVFGTNENEEDTSFGHWQNGLEEYSLSGEKLDNTARSIGQMGSYILTGTLGNPAIKDAKEVIRNAMTIFTSSYGNSKSEAKRNGASEEDAIKYGLISATAETLSEQMFDAIPALKSSGWLSKLTNKSLGKFFSGKTGKVIMNIIRATEEGTEEIFSNLFNVTGNYIMDLYEKAKGNEKGYEYGMKNLSGNILTDLKNTLTSEETWEAFFSAALSTTLTNGGTDIVNNVRYNNAINNYAKQNNVSVEQAKTDFSKVLGAAVEENTTKDMSAIDKFELEESLKKQLTKSVKGGLNLSEAAQAVRTDQDNQYHKFEFTQGEQQDYKDNEIANNMLQKAQQANFDNTKKSHDYVKTAIKVAEELNVNVDFTNNEEIAQQLIKNRQQELGRELTQKEKTALENYAGKINGMKLGNNILLNTDSKQSAKYTLGHEMKHFLEQNTKLNEELNEKLIEWAKLKGNYDTDYNNLSSLYKNVQNANIIDELTANYTGEFFSSEANMKAFATENPGLFTKIANYFKKLYYKATNQQEKLLVQEINEKIQKVYSQVSKERANLPIDRSSKVDIGKDTKFSKSFNNILLRNKNLNPKSNIDIVKSNEKINTSNTNSQRLQTNFKNNVKTGEYKNKATDYIASVDSETKGKILRPNGTKTNTTSKEYILRMIAAQDFPKLFENSVYIDTLSPMKGKNFNPNELGYHHFVAPIEIDGDLYRALISGKEKQNSKKLYSLNIEILPQKNGNTPLANTKSGSQLRGVSPSEISISDLVKDVKLYNYDTKQQQVYNAKDIKYSLSPSGEMIDNNGDKVTFETSQVPTTLPVSDDRTLMAIHNLNEDKFKGVIELGGFPVPSIAITNPSKINHEGYGNISVLFDKNTIDPFNNQNEVYSRDVWSPRFPTINREILRDNVSKVAKNIGISDSSLEYLAEEYNKTEDLSYRISRDTDVVEKYLNDNNISYNNETNIRKLAEENGIIEYLNNQLKDIYGKKGIRNDKEIYTPSGSRRSFNQLHDEYNLENLVKTLTKKKIIGGEESFASGTGVGTIEAKLSKKLNSIEDIKKYESEIKDISYEEKQKFKDAVYDDMAELNEFRKYKSEYSFYDNSGYALNDFAEYKEQNLTNLKKALEKNEIDSTKVPESLLNKTIKDINALKNIPTDYFEAKPQRAVTLDEIQQAIIPNNLDNEFKQQLQDNGIKYTEYDPTIEGDRQRVINQFQDLKFQLGQQTDILQDKDKTSLSELKVKDKVAEKIEKQVAKETKNLPIKKLLNLPSIKKYEEQKQTKTVKKETNLPTAKNTQQKKITQKNTMPLMKNENIIKISNEIANEINKTDDFKLRSWVETSTESDILKDKVYIEDLDPGKITYEVQSNKKSLDAANKHLDTYGYEGSLKYVDKLLRSDGLPKASDVALMQRMVQEAVKRGDYETAQDLIMDTAILGTDLGQATQALSIIQRLTPEGQLAMYTKLVQRAKARGEKSFENVKITPEMVQNILEAYNEDGTYDQKDLNQRVEKFKQDIADQLKTTTVEKIDAWRYLAMLGNPKTHIRNIVSNVAMRGTIKVKNAVARTLESVLPIESKTKTWKKASQDVVDFAKKTAIDMKDDITGQNKYNEKSAIESKKQIFKNKTLEKISNFNSNALEAEDWFFSKRAFQDTLAEYLTANNINTLEDIENNPGIVEKGKLYAIEQAEIATFRQYSKLAAAISQFERKGKVGKVAVEALMPFKRTPINIAKTGIAYSPLGLIKSISYDAYQLQQGNITASQFIDNLSQGLTGSTLTLLGYALAKAGFLTGSGGDDKDEKYDKQLGNTGYSIKIGDKSYTISWLSPVAMPLLVGANAYEQLEEEKEWDMNVVSETLAKTLDPLNEMSFLQSLTNALQSYGSGTDKIKGSLESAAQSYVAQFFPTLFSQFASTLDDKKRSTKPSNNSTYKFGEQTIRNIMYKIPGLRQQLEPATDIWGNEKQQSNNIIQRAFESFIAPYTKNKDISTDLDKEIKKVYTETGEKGVIPNIPYAYIKYGNETYKMSASEYTEYKKTYGKTASQTLNSLINSNDYKESSYEDKAKMIDNVYEYAKAVANDEYFNDKFTVGYENQTLDKINTLEERYNITPSKYYANKKEYDYAYSNPEKYSAIKQITSYDKYVGYKDEIENIKSQYDDTNSRKLAVQQYINSLKLNRYQKIMLQKLAGGYSISSYENEMFNYINSLNMTRTEKETLHKQLFG